MIHATLLSSFEAQACVPMTWKNTNYITKKRHDAAFTLFQYNIKSYGPTLQAALKKQIDNLSHNKLTARNR